MPTLTLAVPKDLKTEMDSLPELNWSEVARDAIAKKIAEYKLFKSIVAKSKLKEKDALAIGKVVNTDLYSEYKKRFNELK
ncbi:MAG: hypothetical protein Q7K42_00610 [Candidatus Diapherotrites archaeon]|nr:hypothetical protein [Candidatus Diapherotrites archaeon]